MVQSLPFCNGDYYLLRYSQRAGMNHSFQKKNYSNSSFLFLALKIIFKNENHFQKIMFPFLLQDNFYLKEKSLLC